MRRTFLVVLVALVCVPAALALEGATGDGTLSVKRARGFVGLAFNGAVIGRIAHGRVVISDPVASDGDGADFWGCDRQRDINDTTTFCAGDDLHFRAIGGRYRIGVKGSGVFLSAVGHGKVTLDGSGDSDHDGMYSINDADYQSLPDEPTTFTLAAPAGG